MQTLTQESPTINFSTICRVITATTVWPTLQVGQKVLYRTTQRHTGWQRDAKAILVRKPADMQRKATIKVRGKDEYGNVVWKTKSVETNNLFRYEWPDAQPVEAKPAIKLQDYLTPSDLRFLSVQAAEAVEESMSEGEFMHATVDAMRSGTMSMTLLTDEQMREIEDERIGDDFSQYPFYY